MNLSPFEYTLEEALELLRKMDALKFVSRRSKLKYRLNDTYCFETRLEKPIYLEKTARNNFILFYDEDGNNVQNISFNRLWEIEPQRIDFKTTLELLKQDPTLTIRVQHKYVDVTGPLTLILTNIISNYDYITLIDTLLNGDFYVLRSKKKP